MPLTRKLKLGVIMLALWTLAALIVFNLIATNLQLTTEELMSYQITNEKIMYYEGANRFQWGGLDQNTRLLMWQLADALYHNCTHVIVEKASLMGSKQHPHSIHADSHYPGVNITVNESWYYYYDIDRIAQETNLQILHYQDDRAKKLLKKYDNTNQTNTIGWSNRCNDALVSNESGVTIRSGSPGYWKPCLHMSTSPIGIHKIAAFSSANVFESIERFEMRTNDSSQCILHGRVRRGDRMGGYKLIQHRQLVSAKGVAAVSAHLAQKYCAKNSKVKLYLATNGKDKFVKEVEDNLNYFDPISLITSHDLIKKLNETYRYGAEEMMKNNYFTYQVEKAMPYYKDLIDVHFVFRPWWDPAKVFNCGDDIYHNFHDEWFSVFYGEQNQSIYFKDVRDWLFQNKSRNQSEWNLFKYLNVTK